MQHTNDFNAAMRMVLFKMLLANNKINRSTFQKIVKQERKEMVQ